MIEIKDLSVSYGLITALRDISISVSDTEIYAIIGANGAGKTTLLRAIMGIKKPDHGTIKLEGKEISGIPTHKRVKLGLSWVPEGRHLFPFLTVLENLRLGAYFVDSKEELDHRLSAVMRLFPQLGDFLNRRARDLSGGQQQMVAIARAMMSKPRVLLLDEPSTGLMPKAVNELFRTVAELRRETTIVLVEQNAKKALATADRVAVLQTGRLVVESEAKSLANDPAIKKAYLGG